jgi:hypothetical protein
LSFPVALEARHILLPVNLFHQDGSRLVGPLPPSGSVSAMVVGLTGDGVVFQEMHPLRLRDRAYEPFDGNGWELRSLPVSAGYHAYYLGIPDTLFAAHRVGDEKAKSNGKDKVKAKVKALSLEVIGSSSLGRTVGFSGGVDLHLEAEEPVPEPVALIQLLERFYPDLWAGLDTDELELVPDPTDGSWVLWLPARSQNFVSPPPALSPHFHPRMHQGAIVEGLGVEGDAIGYFAIRAGCFREANGRLGHWFGQRFGQRIAALGLGFRRTAQALSGLRQDDGRAGWYLWLQPIGLSESSRPQWHGPAAIRHAALHQALGRGFPGQGDKPGDKNRGPVEVQAALRALEELAHIWQRHQKAILAWRSAPAASEWVAQGGGEPGLGQSGSSSDPNAYGQELPQVARDFIQRHGEGLRVLERLQEEEWESAALRHPVDRLLHSIAAQPGRDPKNGGKNPTTQKSPAS